MNSDMDHAEMLVIHLDTILRGRMGTLSEAETEDTIKACLELLRYMVVRFSNCCGYICDRCVVVCDCAGGGGGRACVFLVELTS